MTRHPLWSDDYWLLLMQLYLKKPVGIKPIYSRQMVDLSIELHIPPQVLYRQMFSLRQMETPYLERLWKRYGSSPKRLGRAVDSLRHMSGFNDAKAFYQGVEVNETFEKYFKPIPSCPDLKPVMLIMILDLYFRLTPITMTAETPEVIQLARLMHVPASRVVEVMAIYQCCDPFLKHRLQANNELSDLCKATWDKYGNDDPEKLSAEAAQLKEYFV